MLIQSEMDKDCFN